MEGDRIFIRELAALCVIGVHERERREKREVLISLDLRTDLAAAASSDRLEDTLDYGAVEKKVRSLVEGSSFRLLEALAGAVAAACLEFPAVTRVRVSVEKPGALGSARSAGVEVTRSRGGRPAGGGSREARSLRR